MTRNQNKTLTDSLHGEDRDTEEVRELGDVRYEGYLRAIDRLHILNKIIKGDAQTRSHEDVGHHGYGREILEIWYPA